MTERAAGRPFVIGVTGNIACGKSTVLRRLAELGAETIDADLLYRRLIEPGQPLRDALIARFGPEIAGADGRIDRRALGRIVFADPAALVALDVLTHPAVIAAIEAAIAVSRVPVVAVDGVKLIESGLAEACDAVWLVTCPPEQQRRRLMARNGLSLEDAERRLGAQPPLAPKLGRADAVIDNGGAPTATRARVDALWSALSRARVGDPA